MRDCGSCNACCSGYLTGEVDSVGFGSGVMCSKLQNQRCTIYSNRPAMCSNYFCAWSQGLLPEWMRPDKIGVVVSVERKDETQFLNVIYSGALDPTIESHIHAFTTANHSFYKKTKVIPIKS